MKKCIAESAQWCKARLGIVLNILGCTCCTIKLVENVIACAPRLSGSISAVSLNEGRGALGWELGFFALTAEFSLFVIMDGRPQWLTRSSTVLESGLVKIVDKILLTLAGLAMWYGAMFVAGLLYLDLVSRTNSVATSNILRPFGQPVASALGLLFAVAEVTLIVVVYKFCQPAMRRLYNTLMPALINNLKRVGIV